MDVPAASGGDDVTRGFLFADLRDYTQLVETRGAVEAKRALERYQTLTREAVSRRGGAEIRTEGDSFFVVLPSASAAVRCGLDLVAASLAPPDGGDRISVGVGIHAGETVSHGGDYVGSAVNIAARICAVARPHELLASGTVRELTRSVVLARFVPAGRRSLKGIAGAVELFRVVPALAQSSETRSTPVGVGSRDRRVWWTTGAVLLVLGIGGAATLAQTLAPAPRASSAPSGLAFESPGPTIQPSRSPIQSSTVTPAATLPTRDAGNPGRPPAVPPGTYSPNLNRDVASF